MPILYANLQQFLHDISPPAHACRDELAAYEELIGRFDRGGQLHQAAAPAIAALLAAMIDAHRV